MKRTIAMILTVLTVLVLFSGCAGVNLSLLNGETQASGTEQSGGTGSGTGIGGASGTQPSGTINPWQQPSGTLNGSGSATVSPSQPIINGDTTTSAYPTGTPSASLTGTPAVSQTGAPTGYPSGTQTGYPTQSTAPTLSGTPAASQTGNAATPPQTSETISGDPDQSFGGDLDNSGIYDGYFDTDEVKINIEYISGTQNAYTLNGNVLTFSGLSADSVYSISGQMTGNIVIDAGDTYKFELEMRGFSIVSNDSNPIYASSGDKIKISAKKDTENYIYDKREAIPDTDLVSEKGAIFSASDLEIGGKGVLTVVSDNNNGIDTNDDLEVQNLTLSVTCKDNALKGSDSVSITSGDITLISSKGDGIKSSNSDISTKGNQRGVITLTEAKVTVYAACDGIDASYDIVINGETTELNIYTDKYSNYSEEVTATSESQYYIRNTSSSYSYSVKYYNSDTDFVWADATYHSTVSGRRTTYYYYTVANKTGYSKMQVYTYSTGMTQSQDTSYYSVTEAITPNTAYDTVALSGGGYSWTNYTTSTQGPGGAPGGMDQGNTDKGDHSTKGLKAENEIIINAGTVSIKAYDDAIHANNTAILENGATPLGNVTINGGTVSLYSNDDGLHADGTLAINGGNISVLNSYEGAEGNIIVVSGGTLSIIAKDDGMNSCATSGVGMTFSGGYVYISCTGDGIDSNSRTSYGAISFEGGDVIVISNSNGNSAIDSDGGYKYTAGSVVAIMPNGGMTSESTHCSNFSSVGTTKTMSLTEGKTVTISGELNMTFSMPCSISNAYVVMLNKSNSIS